MSNIKKYLNKLISQSSTVLSELNRENPEYDKVKEKLDRREYLIQEFGTLAAEFNKNSLSDNEQEVIQSLFDKFEHLNKKIEDALQSALRESREKLSSATKKRKAAEKYQSSATPNLTHF